MNPTDRVRLREGIEKAERAAPRAWVLDGIFIWRPDPPSRDVAEVYDDKQGKADGEYIVHAANDYPALARAHLELLEENEALWEVICTSSRGWNQTLATHAEWSAAEHRVAELYRRHAALAAGSATETKQE